MLTPPKPEKKKKPRRVFGRVRYNGVGATVTVEMGKDAIRVRVLRSKRVYYLPIEQVIVFVMTNSPLANPPWRR